MRVESKSESWTCDGCNVPITKDNKCIGGPGDSMIKLDDILTPYRFKPPANSRDTFSISLPKYHWGYAVQNESSFDGSWAICKRCVGIALIKQS